MTVDDLTKKGGIVKRFLLSAILLISAGIPAVASAAATKLPASYQAIYCYPTGSYWAQQRAAYPAYYAANDAYYRAQYGPGTIYCP